MADPHTVATFAFARFQRDQSFRNAFPWLRNTVICVDSDLIADVINDRMTHYFPEGGSIACYSPARRKMYFAQAVPKTSPLLRQPLPGDDVLDLKEPATTVGMIFDWLGSQNGIDAVEFGEVSTVEVERELALA